MEGRRRVANGMVRMSGIGDLVEGSQPRASAQGT